MIVRTGAGVGDASHNHGWDVVGHWVDPVSLPVQKGKHDTAWTSPPASRTEAFAGYTRSAGKWCLVYLRNRVFKKADALFDENGTKKPVAVGGAIPAAALESHPDATFDKPHPQSFIKPGSGLIPYGVLGFDPLMTEPGQKFPDGTTQWVMWAAASSPAAAKLDVDNLKPGITLGPFDTAWIDKYTTYVQQNFTVAGTHDKPVGKHFTITMPVGDHSYEIPTDPAFIAKHPTVKDYASAVAAAKTLLTAAKIPVSTAAQLSVDLERGAPVFTGTMARTAPVISATVPHQMRFAHNVNDPSTPILVGWIGTAWAIISPRRRRQTPTLGRPTAAVTAWENFWTEYLIACVGLAAKDGSYSSHGTLEYKMPIAVTPGEVYSIQLVACSLAPINVGVVSGATENDVAAFFLNPSYRSGSVGHLDIGMGFRSDEYIDSGGFWTTGWPTRDFFNPVIAQRSRCVLGTTGPLAAGKHNGRNVDLYVYEFDYTVPAGHHFLKHQVGIWHNKASVFRLADVCSIGAPWTGGRTDTALSYKGTNPGGWASCRSRESVIFSFRPVLRKPAPPAAYT